MREKRKMPNRLRLGLATGLLVFAGIASAAGQIAILTNDTIIEPGEELGATVVLNGDGQYDVYVAITGGVLGETFYLFDSNGGLVPWIPTEGLPEKFRSNLDLASLAIQEKMIQVLPRIPLVDIAGNYTFYAGLTTPGQLDFPVLDTLPVEVK